MTNTPKKRDYLINPRFQVKWALIIAFVEMASAGLLASILWGSIDKQLASRTKGEVSFGKQLASLDQQTILLGKLDEFERGIEYHQELMVQLLNQPDLAENELKRYDKNFNVAKEDLTGRKTTRDQLMVLISVMRAQLVALNSDIGRLVSFDKQLASLDQQASLLSKLDEFDKRGIEFHQELMVQLLNQPDRSDQERERYEKNFNVAKEDLTGRKTTRDQLVALNSVMRDQLVAFNSDMRNQSVGRNTLLKYYLIIFILLVGLCSFICGIILTHRVARPLFALQKALEKFEESAQPIARPVSNKDEFQDTYQAVAECLTHIAAGRHGSGQHPPTDRPAS